MTPVYQIGETPPLNLQISPESVRSFESAVDLARAVNEQIDKLARETGAVIHPRKLTPKQIRRLRQKWLKQYIGPSTTKVIE